jgi:hypothetical protein
MRIVLHPDGDRDDDRYRMSMVLHSRSTRQSYKSWWESTPRSKIASWNGWCSHLSNWAFVVRPQQLLRNDFLHAVSRNPHFRRWCKSPITTDSIMANSQSVFVFTCVWGFLVASFPKYAASAMAGNTLVRCIWAAGFPLFADPVS